MPDGATLPRAKRLLRQPGGSKGFGGIVEDLQPHHSAVAQGEELPDAALEWSTAESALAKDTSHGGNLVASGTDFLDHVSDIGTRLDDLARHICESLIPVKVTGGVEHAAHLPYLDIGIEEVRNNLGRGGVCKPPGARTSS
jgi:hypothetical protein